MSQQGDEKVGRGCALGRERGVNQGSCGSCLLIYRHNIDCKEETECPVSIHF